MKPILFGANATSWGSFGIGVLTDAIECIVEENRNGAYELELEYPITGNAFAEITLRRIIVAKPNYTDDPQPFRIYEISKPINGIVTVRAQHISYDLSGYVAAPFTAVGSQAALAQMCDPDTVYPADMPFTLETDISSSKTMDVKCPASVRALFGGVEGSLLDNYGGEWHFDGYTCSLKAARGANRGVVIRYGKNLTDLRQEENNASVYTGVYPYYYNQESEVLVTLPERVVTVPGTFDYAKILPLDLSANFENTPTEAQLRAATESYIETNAVGTPKINITISFVELDSLSDRVDLCDSVSVVFDTLGIAATAKCIRTRWDVLKGRYIEAELGSARNSLAGTIANTPEVQHAIEEHSNQFTAISRAIASKVTGNSGGNIVINDTDGDGEPDEILVMDTDDISTAVKIIRINNGGIAFSKDGYNGTYETAWNIDGEFVANFIASGELNAELVKIIGDTNFTWDSANIEIKNPSNPLQMIRFGKYDGTNYGLAFSRDGGVTWGSGFGFDGIQLTDPSDSSNVAKFSGSAFWIRRGSLNITYLGYRTDLKDSSGNTVSGLIYRIGTYRGTAMGLESVAIGFSNMHSGYRSFAAGYYTTSSGNYSVAIGSNCESTGAYSIAIGYNAEAGNTYANAIGYKSLATAENASAFGPNNKVTAYYSTAVGYTNVVSGASAFAAGNANKAEGVYSYAIGSNCEATAMTAFALGEYCKASQEGSTVIGYYLLSSGRYTVAYGQFNTGASYTDGRVVIGVGTGNSNRVDGAIFYSNGNLEIAGSLIQGSDERLKTIIGDAPDVSSIRAKRFIWNDNKPSHDNIEHIGYIAQDVEKVAPYLVQDNGLYKSLDYIGLLCAKIESLERTVDALKSRIDQLEGAR